MVTWKVLKSAAHAVHYFRADIEFGRIAAYFTGERGAPRRRRHARRADSHWHGAGAAALGLRAAVGPQAFRRVLEGYVPGTNLRLGRIRRDAPRTAPDPAAGTAAAPDRDWQHRPGGDLTFSAPKSVSLEALVYARPRTRARVVRAHDDAVRETLDFAERELLQTRSHDPATGRQPRVQAHGLVAACFRHVTSRALDPQLHTHAVLANMTRDTDGNWRSADFTAVSRSKLLLGAVYRTALQRRLEALGYATVATLVGSTPGFEIAGYPKRLIDHFSQRRQEILDWIERQGHAYSARIAELAALVTRRRKREPGRDELDALWSARASHYGPGRDREAARGRSGAPAPPVPPALEITRRAVEHLEERHTVVARNQIRGWALAHAAGRHELADIDRALAGLEHDEGLLVPAPRRRLDAAYTTRRALASELAILAQVRAGIDAGGPLADAGRVAARLDGSGLDAGQRGAAELVLLAPHRVVGVQGHAGTGKTTMLRAVAALAAGRPVLALAPSAAASRVLGAETGLPAGTLARLLTRYRAVGMGTAGPADVRRARAALADALVIVDEASMIGNSSMQLLLGIAERAGVARVALVGDRRQLPSVEAGTPFRLMQDRGLPTAAMTDVRRQRTPGLQAVVQHLLARKPDLAIEALGAAAIEVPDGDDTTAEAAARLWLELPPEDRARTAIVAPTQAERAEIAAVIRTGLAAEGVLRGGALTIDRYVNLHLTRAEKGDPVHYRPGDIAVFHADLLHLRIQKDDACEVLSVEADRVVLAHPDGAARRIRPDSQVRYRLELYEPRPIDLRAGDRIRWTRNWRRAGLDLDNGAPATITGVDRRRVRFRADDGRDYSLGRDAPQLHHLDHAYSTTVYGAQGMTCDAVIAVLDAGRGVPPDQAAVYVELTRARDSAVLLTNDREALVDALEARTGEKRSALEAVGARRERALTPPPRPRLQPELIAWEAFADDARAHGQHPFAAPGHLAALAPVLALANPPDGPAPAGAARVAADHRAWAAARARKQAEDDLRAGLADCGRTLARYLEARSALAGDPVRGGAAAAAAAAYARLLDQADAAIARARGLAAADPAAPAGGDLAGPREDLRRQLEGAEGARRHDAGALACCRRLAALDRAAAAAGSHRCRQAGYPALVAAIRELATALPPGERLVAALATVPAEAAAIAAAAGELDRFMTRTVPAFLRARANAGQEDRDIAGGRPAAARGRGGGTGREAARRLADAADRLLRAPACRPHLDADPARRRWIAAVRAALVTAAPFEDRAGALLRDLGRCQRGPAPGDPRPLPGAGRIVAGVRGLQAEWRRLPPVPPPLPLHAPGAAYPGAGEPLARAPAPLAAFRRQHLEAAGRRMALRTDLVGRIDAVTARLTARRRILDSAARSGRAVTDDPGYRAWREQSEPLARQRLPRTVADPGGVPPGWLGREPLWARSERSRRQLADALRLDRRVAAALRAVAAVRRRAAAAGVHAVHLPEGRRLASAVDALRERAAHPGGLPADLDTFRSEAAQLAASARTIAAFVGTTVPELAARPARLNEEPALTDGGRHEPPSVDDRSPSARAAMRAGERILNDPHCHPLLDAVPAFRTWVGAAVDACRAALGFHADARTLEERRRSLENSGPGWERRHREEADALAAAIARLAQRRQEFPDLPRGPPAQPADGPATRGGAHQAYRLLADSLPADARYGTLVPALPAPLAAFRERWREIGPLIDRDLRIQALVDARTGGPIPAERAAARATPSGPRHRSDPGAAPTAPAAGGPVPTPPGTPPDDDRPRIRPQAIQAGVSSSLRRAAPPVDAELTAADLRSRHQARFRELAAALAMDARILRCRRVLARLDRGAADAGSDRFHRPQYPDALKRARDLYAAYRDAPAEHRTLYAPWPAALATLLAEHRTRTDAATARIRTYVTGTAAAVLRTRADIDGAVRGRGGLTGLQEHPAYPAWHARATAAIDDGRRLANAEGGLAMVLDADPGRRRWIADATSFLADTLAYDARAQALLRRCRGGGGHANTAAPGARADAELDPPALDALRALARDGGALQARQPAAAFDAAPAPAGPPSLPAPLLAMLSAAAAQRKGRLDALAGGLLAQLQSASGERDRLRQDAARTRVALTTHDGYDRWRQQAAATVGRASAHLGWNDAWLDAYHPLPDRSAQAPAAASRRVALLEQAFERDRTAEACTAGVIGHALAAIDAGRDPYADADFAAIAGPVQAYRRIAAEGEFPPMLEPVADAPESLPAAHARIWQLGTTVLPDLEERLGRRRQRCAEARRRGCGVTEVPGYADWDERASRAASAVPDEPQCHDPAADLHWEVVRRRADPTVTPTRLLRARDEVVRAAAIDRDARALLGHPLRPAEPDPRPWTRPARAGRVAEYERYVHRIDALAAQADRPGEMPPSLTSIARNFRSWQADEADIALVRTAVDAVRRSGEELDGAGSDDGPYRETDPEAHRRWLEQLRNAGEALAALRQQRQHARDGSRTWVPRGHNAALRAATLLPHLDRLPARDLERLHHDIEGAPQDAGRWYSSNAAGNVVHAWREIARVHAKQIPGGQLPEPRAIRDLREGGELHRHVQSIQFLADHLQSEGPDFWLTDIDSHSWQDDVQTRIAAARRFCQDEARLQRLSCLFPDLTKALSGNLDTVSRAFEEHQARVRPSRERATLETAHEPRSPVLDPGGYAPQPVRPGPGHRPAPQEPPSPRRQTRATPPTPAPQQPHWGGRGLGIGD